MTLLTESFEQLLSMALTALPVMAVVLAARWLLRKAPKTYTYLLWLVVAFRLLCPVAPESPVGFITEDTPAALTPEWTDSYVGPSTTTFNNEANLETFKQAVEAGREPYYGGEPGAYYVVTAPDGVSAPATVSSTLLPVAAVVWLLGIAVMAAYLIFSTLRLRRHVATAVWREENIWECDNIPTPFVLGLLRPRIYIPFRMTETERTYILAHERYHIRRGDHWAKLLGLLILAVYWWNPAVWLCWVLFCRDMEMRCDEAVLAELGDGVKREYSLSLISFALDRRAPMALAFGEHDAAKRVKNVLRWKRAKPAVMFLAVAAVALVALVCGTNARSGKENKVTIRTVQDGGVEFEVTVTEDIHSWCLYRDIYHNGTLISSSETVLDGFADENAGVSTRDFTGRLWAELAYDLEGGFTNELTWNATMFGTFGFTETLPEKHYTGMAVVAGEGETETVYQPEPDEDILLCSLLLTTAPDLSVTVSSADRPLTQLNNTVVQYRLLLSSGTIAELPVPQLDLAQALFDLRLTSLRSSDDAKPLLEKLGVGGLGGYEVKTFEEGDDKVLLVAYDRHLTMEEQLEMHDAATMLLALIGDVTRVDFSYYKETTGSLFTVYCDRDQPDSWAKNMGYADIKAMGKTPAGIRSLMKYLGWNTGSEDTASPLAQALYAARNEPEKLLSLLDPAAQLGRCEIQGAPSGYLTMLFHDAPMDASLRDTVIWKYSMVMLALLDNYNATSWNWMDGGALAYEGNSGLWNTKEWLEEHGLDSDVRTYGTSPAQVQILLEKLNLYDSISVQQLFAQSQTQDAMELTETLLETQLWGSAVSGGTVVWPGNFGPSVHFSEVPGNPDALDTAMARRAVALMKLRPQEVNYVHWSYPDKNGEMVRRDLHADEMGAVIALSSDSQISQPVGSATDLARLIRFLNNLDGKAFLMWVEEGNPLSPERLAEQDAVWFAPEDIRDIEYATLEWWDGQRFYPLTGEGYEYIEERLGTASQIGVTGCPFQAAVLYLHRADGVVGKVIPAGDSCDVFLSDGKYYQFGDRAQTPYYDDNSTLFAHFGTGTEELPHYTTSADTGPEPEEPHVFVNVLLKQEVVGDLLDGYVPWDIYCDLDTWEDESVTELPCYVYYYGLSRAQFRQFMEGLETIPDELKDVELEGDAADVANITVSGIRSRAEIERLSAAIQQRQQTEAPEEGFTDIMGYSGYAVTERQAGSWYLRTYYTIQGGGPMKIAETFGYGQPQDYVVDLDGDGVTELIANVTFGGDGARRAYVYQRRGNDVYLGDPSADGLPNFNNWGANASWSEYDPLEQVFRIHYSQKNSDEYGVLETRDLSRFQFSKFAP